MLMLKGMKRGSCDGVVTQKWIPILCEGCGELIYKKVKPINDKYYHGEKCFLKKRLLLKW